MQLHDSTSLPRNAKDLTGQRFGSLTVVSFSYADKHYHVFWNCRCTCGNECCVRVDYLTRGKHSCGCLNVRRPRVKQSVLPKEKKRPKPHKKHNGRSKHPLYYVRQMMIRRCHSPKDKSYRNYGARGIVVCDRWRESFDNFLADVGERPPGTSLGRIDNDGPYSPENCRWETKEEQANNTRQNHLLRYRGDVLTMTQWGKKLGIDPKVIRLRLRYGWSIERALTLPVRPKRPNHFAK